MAEKGWSAEGLLLPLWNGYPGGRDELAKKVGTTGNSLSARNSGKRTLGIDLGKRLAGELEVSLLELGAPEAMAVDEASRTLADRLRSLEDDLSEAVQDLVRAHREINQVRARVRRLEARPSPSEGSADGKG